MRLSFILSSLWPSGGVNAVIQYANGLTARGHHVSLVIPAGTIDPVVQAQLNPGPVLIESKASLHPSRNIGRLVQLTLSMTRAVPPADIVVATHTPTVAPALLATRLARKGRPLWLYMDYAEMFAGRPLEKFLMKHGPKWFERVVVLSEASRRDVGRDTGVQATVVGLGLNQPELLLGDGDEPRRLDPHYKRVLYVGDSRPRKGLQEFLTAAEIVYRRLPDLRLSIVSKERCEINTTTPFDFYHYPSREKLGALYRNSHLFVSASWAEGFGYPPLEAMACGTPVILTNSRGVLEYARPSENCLLVPPQQPEALAEAMYRVLLDDRLAARFRAKGPEVAKPFDWESAVDRFESVIKKMVGQQ